MKRKLIITLVTCLVLAAVAGVWMRALAVSVLREESQHQMSVSWAAPQEHLSLVARKFRIDLPSWRPLTIEIEQRPVNTDRLATALGWLPRSVESMKINPQDKADALKLYHASMRFHDLVYFALEGVELDGPSFTKLARLPKLKGLSLDALPENLPEMPYSASLEVMSVKKTPGAELFKKVYAFPNLRRLHVAETNMTPAEVMAFNWRHPSIESLALGCTGASRAELAAWAELIKRQAPGVKQVQVSSGTMYLSR